MDASPRDDGAGGTVSFVGRDAMIVDSSDEPIDSGAPASPQAPPVECRIVNELTGDVDESCDKPIRWQRTVVVANSSSDRDWVAFDPQGNLYWLLTAEREKKPNETSEGPFWTRASLTSYTSDGAERWTVAFDDRVATGLTVSATQACVTLSASNQNFELPELGLSDAALPDRLDAEIIGYNTVACFALNGEVRWARDIAGTLVDVDSMSSDGQGNLFLAGAFYETLAISPAHDAELSETNAFGDSDAFVASYTPDGAPRWLTTMASDGLDDVTSAAALSDGRVAILGDHGGAVTIGAETVDLGPTPNVFGSAYVALLDQDGELAWAVRSLASDDRPDDETRYPNQLMVDARQRIVVSYDYEGFHLVVHGDDGAIAAQYTADVFGAHECDVIAGYEGGIACFGDWEDPDHFDGALFMTDFDFAPSPARVLVDPLTEPEFFKTLGRSSLAFSPDGSIAVTSQWSEDYIRRLVVLEP